MSEGRTTGRTIFLVGFMGVGKSTLGRRLAKRLRMPFYDMDEEIERTSGKKIHEMFETEGEGSFRALETELLRSIVKREPGVVATGGGTFCRPENRELIRAGGVSVWLDAPTEVILERGAQETHRPLWTNLETVESLLDERLPLYRQADLHFRVQSFSPDDAAARLADLLEAHRKES
ncbi:MAG: shikimate kinase [Vicinamibacteria bacterium]